MRNVIQLIWMMFFYLLQQVIHYLFLSNWFNLESWNLKDATVAYKSVCYYVFLTRHIPDVWRDIWILVEHIYQYGYAMH